jgi:hypothetical protein
VLAARTLQLHSRDEAVISSRQNVVSWIDGDHINDAAHVRSAIPGVGPGDHFLIFSESDRFPRPDDLSVCDPSFSAPFVEHGVSLQHFPSAADRALMDGGPQ